MNKKGVLSLIIIAVMVLSMGMVSFGEDDTSSPSKPKPEAYGKMELTEEQKELKEQDRALRDEMKALMEQLKAAQEAGDEDVIMEVEESIEALKQSVKDLGYERQGPETGEQPAKRKELNSEKRVKDEEKQDIIESINALAAALKEAEEAGDDDLIASIQADIDERKETLEKISEEIKQAVDERKGQAWGQYSDEEKEAFRASQESIKKKFTNSKVLNEDGIIFNGKPIKFDSPPFVDGGRTLIPIRAITESLGAEVSWDDETQTVTIVKDDTTIELIIGSNTALVNGEEVELDTKADIVNARTYVPVRFISEVLGADVNWDGDNGIVEVDYEDDGTEEEVTE